MRLLKKYAKALVKSDPQKYCGYFLYLIIAMKCAVTKVVGKGVDV